MCVVSLKLYTDKLHASIVNLSIHHV